MPTALQQVPVQGQQLTQLSNDDMTLQTKWFYLLHFQVPRFLTTLVYIFNITEVFALFHSPENCNNNYRSIILP
jgi:hypothetical protein